MSHGIAYLLATSRDAPLAVGRSFGDVEDLVW